MRRYLHLSEATARRHLVKELRFIHAVPIESPSTRSGIPDINTAYGWIEMKYVASWPKRKETPVRLHRYTSYQKDFLLEREKAGGKAYLMVKVGRMQWFLFKAQEAQVIGDVAKDLFIKLSYFRMTQGFNAKELIRCLKNS